jgi:hypothetical protein
MKTLFRILGVGAAVALASPHAALAQQEPIISVDINRVVVDPDGGSPAVFDHPSQNESSGPFGTKVTITALARGTFDVYSYVFYVNGVMLDDKQSSIPAGTPAVTSWAPPQPGSYLLTVKATDSFGHSATSLAVRYFATGTAVVGPVDNTLVPNGSSVVIQATATPPPLPSAAQAFVQRVEFVVDGELVGTDYTYPYSYIYTPKPTPTTHEIQAIGYDNLGKRIEPVGLAAAKRNVHMVSAIGTPPIVRVANPPNGGSFQAGTAVEILAEAVAPDGFIKNVDFYVNGVLLSSSQTFPFKAAWTPLVPGKYEVVVIGFDDKSNAVASTPITLTATGDFPTVSIADPATSGMTVVQGSTVPITVRASGADGGVASLKAVEFLVNGQMYDSLPKAPPPSATGPTTPPVLTPPFVFNWKSNVAVGTHRLSARVTSASNLVITSAEVTVNVVANQPPVVGITSPAPESSGAVNVATTIVVSANDSDGTIETVEFFANGTRIGMADKSPFQLVWTPGVAGTYSLTAKATDNGGKVTISDPVSMIVDPPSVGGPAQANVTATVFRGDYGSLAESGKFALAVNRNNRGTFIGYSTLPTGRTYFWNDIPINPDGTFAVRDASNAVVLSGQTSSTGVSGTFGDRTFIGPITPSTGAFSPLLVNGTVTGVAGSQMIAIVGGDSSITLYAASGANRVVGSAVLTSTGAYTIAAPTGGTFSGTVANSVSIVSGTVTGAVAGNYLLRLQASRITNISTRTLAGTGDRTLMAGFVVAGSGSKPLLVRAVGPTLANFGVANPLADPGIEVLSRLGLPVAANGDWGNSAALATLFNQVGAFALTPGSRDAAVQASVVPGTYTAVVGGGTATPGAALIEVYDTDFSPTVTSRITNLSTRGEIGAGETLIAGFVVAGDVRKKVLIRAVGPTLAGFGLTGLLADPKIDVIAGGAVISSNNDWTESASVSQVLATAPVVGAFPLDPNSRDAALVLQLAPGAYTVQVSGAGSSTGTVLLEIYDADR